MAGLPPRDYLIEEYTTTVCPACVAQGRRRSDDPATFKDGLLISRGDKVWLRRFCGEHGETESLYEEDLEIWRARAGWGTPTLKVTPDRADNFGGFPHGYRQGLPASHGQHTCVLVLNVTERCNYGCSTCYASALAPGTPVPQPEHPTIASLLHTVDVMLEREAGKLGVVMLSGGEPTVRDDLPEIVKRLAERNVTRVMINTNGRRIARDDRFLSLLHDLRGRVEVYLQFDGFRPETYRALRGEDVSREKTEALRRLSEAGIFTTLVMTVRRGVNEEEVGDVAMLGLETPRCAGLAIQPEFGSGRVPGYDPRNRVTPTGVLRRLGEQTNGLITWQDFLPLPCSHRDCCDITYMVRRQDGNWSSLPKLVGKAELKNWIHLAANTITFETLSAPVAEMLRSGALQRVFSEQLKVGTPDLMRDLGSMCECVPGLPQLLGGIWSLVGKQERALERAAERTFRLTVKMFMDEHTFHEARIRQCCVHTGTFEEDPRRYSFCWRWLFEDATDQPQNGFVPADALGISR